MTMANLPQAAKTAPPKPETIPIDTSKPLTPTQALSIIDTKHSTILIQDLTPSLAKLFSPTSGLALEAATKLIEATPAPPTLYTLKKQNLLGTHLVVKNNQGKEVAEWRAPVVSLHAAKLTIKFLDREGEKTVEVNPLGHERISESFEINNTTYIWEAESKHHKNQHLYKIMEFAPEPVPIIEASSSNETPISAFIIKKTAREVARYTHKHAHGHGHPKEGLFVINSGEIDELVGVLTLCAMLEQFHKERRNEMIYDKVVSLG